MTVQINVIKGNYRGSTFVTGFHGIGETGYIATSFLVHALQAKRIGFIEVEHPPPFVNSTNEALVTPFEIYRRGRLVIAKLEFSPHKSEESEFLKALSSWVTGERFSEAILIGGLDSSFRRGGSPLRVVHTRAYQVRAKTLNPPRLEEELFVYGPLAIMLSEFEIHDFPALAILPYASASRPDPAAAAVAIRTISKLHNIRVNVSDLERDANEIEAEIAQRMKQTHRSLQGMFV
ncbi:proteasome assembly chaperone family protein [Candidatus Bathyarchaeota archaeon]|nr:proteasome assembly chaperone family protein [Candidatus Bathyarchaeota archaeon]